MCRCMEGGGERKRKSDLLERNWDLLLKDNDDEPPPELVIQEAAAEKLMPSVEVITESEEEESQFDQYLRQIPDKELIDKIARAKRFLAAKNLNDGGEKLRASLKKQQAELDRRTRMKVANKCKKVTPLADESTGNDATDDLSARRACPPVSTSEFGLRFCSKLDDKKATECFGEELSTINRSDHKNMREHVPFSTRRPQTRVLSSRQTPFKSPRHLSVNNDNAPQSNGEQWGSHTSFLLHHLSDKNASSCSAKKESAARCQSPLNSRKNCRKTVVLVDEEEVEVDAVNTEDQVGRSSKGTRVYYPSRDDPEAIEICYSDMECLAPESYLSSDIMNFYIRYLQKLKFPRARRRCDCHFFNTYFYKKLKQDVLAKADKETSFSKFRRWWKGVNIFEKAYIFLPIHENLHWSLVIICIPKKEDKSGPIILHLDSLGLHISKSILNNMKSFLIEEWKFLRQEGLPALPIADNIWDNLSRRIVEKVMEVPQQKNEYDCGLFVLYFMERFLDDAPERLNKDDLEPFGTQWFKPEEASRLRRKIRNLLDEEFKKANEGTSIMDS